MCNHLLVKKIIAGQQVVEHEKYCSSPNPQQTMKSDLGRLMLLL